MTTEISALLKELYTLSNNSEDRHTALRYTVLLDWIFHELTEQQKKKLSFMELNQIELFTSNVLKNIPNMTIFFEQGARKKILPQNKLSPLINWNLDLQNQPLVKRCILQRLIEHSDQINFARAVPQDLSLLPDSPRIMEQLQMMSIFPALLQAGYLQVNDILNLSKAFRFYQKRINQYLLNKFFDLAYFETFNITINFFSLSGDTESFRTAVLVIVTEYNEISEAKLQQVGKQVLNCHLILDELYSTKLTELIERVALFLSLMPNLQILRIGCQNMHEYISSCGEGSKLNTRACFDCLPNLSSLQLLRLQFGSESLISLFLGKYLAQLKGLEVAMCTYLFEVDLKEYNSGSKLETLFLKFEYFDDEVQFNIIGLFEMFTNFNLKSISILFDDDKEISDIASEPCKILEFLGSFTNTLESLTLFFGPKQLVSHSCLSNCSLISYCKISFPKVKQLVYCGAQQPKCWCFLILFPNIEILHFEIEGLVLNEDEVHPNCKLLKLRNCRDFMLNNLLWIVFKKLKRLVFFDEKLNIAGNKMCTILRNDVNFNKK